MRSLLLLLFAAPCAGCTALVLSEESAAVCKNGLDDDDDGFTDCDDSSCSGSGSCEGNTVDCADGEDNDGDQTTDCADEDCRAAGLCESFVSSCAVAPQSGCPSGMGCYRRSMGASEVEYRCRSAGGGRVASTCTLNAIDSLGASAAHPCAAGFGCFAIFDQGMCASYCAADTDCPTGSLCVRPPTMTAAPGICTTPCDPRLLGACTSDLKCVSFHERGEPFVSGGARFACVDPTLVRGTAVVGAPCVDPPVPSTPAAQVCVSSAACVPNGGGAICRALCDVAAPSCASGSCMPLYQGGVPSGVGNIRFGACL